jgi:GR25 family glycosyltransferase involved in LPS biosynthesis
MNAYDESDMNFVPISKINAVDGTDIDIEKVPLSEIAKGELKQIETTGFRSKHYQLTRGAIGCYLSHVKVWKDIIESNQKHGLIFDDDVKLPLNINTRITKSMQHVPDDWDIILFGFHCKDCEKKKKKQKS